MTAPKQESQRQDQGDIIIYQAEDGKTKIDVRFVDETVWLTQQQLCNLYQTSKSNISEHIKHIFEEGELEPEAVRLLQTGGLPYHHTAIWRDDAIKFLQQRKIPTRG